MASSQQTRRDSKTTERDVRLDEQKVTNLTSRFEALVEKSPGGDAVISATTTTTRTLPGAAPVTATQRGAAPVTATQRGATPVSTIAGAAFSPIPATSVPVAAVRAAPASDVGGVTQKTTRRTDVTDKGEERKQSQAQQGGGAHFESIAGRMDRSGGGAKEEFSVERRGQAIAGRVDRGGGGAKEEFGGGAKEEFSGERRGQAKTGVAYREKPKQESYQVGKFEVAGKDSGEETKTAKTQSERENQGKGLEEVKGYRQEAQQNSMDTIRAAEERYAKAKGLASTAVQEAKESATHTVGAAVNYAAHLGTVAKDQTVGGYQYLTEKAAPVKETAAEAAQRKAAEAKETAAGVGGTAAEYTKTVAGKAAETGKTVAAKAAETGKSLGGKAAETGKVVASKAAEVAVEVKDRAVVAGWGTAHYAGEKAVEATRVAAGLVKGAAGIAGDTAAAAKDVAVAVGKKTGEYVEETAVAAGETVAEFAARKRAEAAADLETKKRQGQAPLGATLGGLIEEERGSRVYQKPISGEQKTTSWAETTRVSGGSRGGQRSSETVAGKAMGAAETLTGKAKEAAESLSGKVGTAEAGRVVEGIVEEGGGVLGAIGETLVEIAQGVVPAATEPVAPVVDAATAAAERRNQRQ